MDILELIGEGERVAGRIAEAWGIEDTLSRERQHGLRGSLVQAGKRPPPRRSSVQSMYCRLDRRLIG